MPSAPINGHAMHYEVHGTGDPVLVMGGWGSFCHGEEGHLPWGLAERHRVIIFDHRGVGESGDEPDKPASTRMYAEDAAGLLQHLGIERLHVVGLIGMGACIGQELALLRPGLVRSLVNTGSWLHCDRFLADQLDWFRETHRDLGFLPFQRNVSLMSFEPGYYAAQIDRLLGPQGVWSHLNGRYPAHSRFIDACLAHDTRDRAHLIEAPALILHAGLDMVTGPRTTRPIEAALPNAEGLEMPDAAHVIAGRDLKRRFSDALLAFLARH